MTGLSDAFKDVMTRGAVVDLTDDDFATITAPQKQDHGRDTAWPATGAAEKGPR